MRGADERRNPWLVAARRTWRGAAAQDCSARPVPHTGTQTRGRRHGDAGTTIPWRRQPCCRVPKDLCEKLSEAAATMDPRVSTPVQAPPLPRVGVVNDATAPETAMVATRTHTPHTYTHTLLTYTHTHTQSIGSTKPGRRQPPRQLSERPVGGVASRKAVSMLGPLPLPFRSAPRAVAACLLQLLWEAGYTVVPPRPEREAEPSLSSGQRGRLGGSSCHGRSARRSHTGCARGATPSVCCNVCTDWGNTTFNALINDYRV